MARILVVDDEKSIRLTLREFLKHAGHDVEIAADADEATELLQQSSFDVLITDLILPRVTGVELLKRVRSLELPVQVIMMTGEPTVETATEAVRSGAFDYVAKPIAKDDILKTVANAARLKSLDDEKKRLQNENKRYQEELEILVHKRTSDLQDAYDQLRKAMQDLKQTQKQIIQQERLRALGEMASGIAHDFNNILAVVQGFSSLLLKNVDEPDPAKLKKYLEMISTAAVDGANVVSRMREFYRHREATETFNQVDLNELVPKVISLTQPKWKDQAQAASVCIRIVKELDDAVPLIFGNEAEIREVLMNLIMNAVDAIAGEGCITVRTRKAGREVVVEVEDNGKGMDEDTCRRCFEPFFTTKGEQGTGMGLAVAHGVLRRHDGRLEVESQTGKGTTFRMCLPVQTQTQTAAGPADPSLKLEHPLRILVVDDDPRLRLLLTEYLSADGHTVTPANGGREALDTFAPDSFDLVITDRAMPDMSGELVGQAIKAIVPQFPIIMVTGFGKIMKDNNDVPDGVDLILCKPVEPEDLQRAMAQVMAPPAADDR